MPTYNNYELHIPEPYPLSYNPKTGCFLKGRTPWNKGKTWKQMGISKRKQKKLRENLAKGRKPRPEIGGMNRISVVGVWPDGTWCVYTSATKAAECTGASRPNILKVCRGERKTAGGAQWFFENDNRWCKIISQKQ